MSGVKSIINNVLRVFHCEIQKIKYESYADPSTLEKATIFIERFREIVSDPLNILIKRVPDAGYIDRDDCVILHNGNRVPFRGHLAYYDNFSDILIINRGVHEPLEEYCFQVMLTKIETESPKMVELGSYWAHYSMWLMKQFPKAKCFMVEPSQKNMECGENNFKLNHYNGEFLREHVGSTGFQLDKFTSARKITSLDVLHSDIQGYEIDMLQGASTFLAERRANYVLISTHSETIHSSVLETLASYGYRIEVSSGYDTHTTSTDGFVLASSPKLSPVFPNFLPRGRFDIAMSDPKGLIQYINSVSN
jgi:hypothetical protein